MEQYFMISDAAKEVNVETHVLRYWEEELSLPIKRNDLGHRYYTEEDVECFRQIKSMKERGLQLKAIKVILKDGTLTMLEDGKQEMSVVEEKQSYELVKESSEEKTKRMQYLLQEMLKDAVRANNEALVQDIKEAVIKELDYQFRSREEHEEEMERKWEQRSEEHYKRIDDLLRKKAKRKPLFTKKAQKDSAT